MRRNSIDRRVFLSLLLSALSAKAAAVFLQENGNDGQRKPLIIQSRCVGCGDCIRFCPVKAISFKWSKALVNRKKCVGCRSCVLACSYGAPR